MGYLQGRTVHVDKHLSNLALNYRPVGFIGDMLFPVVNVEKRSDMILTYNQADLFRVDDTTRAPGAEANKVSFQVGSDSYIVKNYALKTGVTLEDRVNADPIFVRNSENGKVFYVTDKLKLDMDKRISDLVLNTSNVGTSANVASAWAADATGVPNSNAAPINDVWTKMDQVQDATGYRPNTVLFGGKAWRFFTRHPDVIDKVNQTGVSGAAMPATQTQVANLLMVDKVLVGEGYYNSGEEGIDNNLTRIWGDHVLVCYAQPRPSLELPSFGYSFRWSAKGLPNWTVERHPYDSRKKVDELEVGYYQDEKVISTALAALISYTGCSQ